MFCEFRWLLLFGTAEGTELGASHIARAGHMTVATEVLVGSWHSTGLGAWSFLFARFGTAVARTTYIPSPLATILHLE